MGDPGVTVAQVLTQSYSPVRILPGWQGSLI